MQRPYDAWTYGLDGALTGAPNMDEVEGFDKADFAPNAVEFWDMTNRQDWHLCTLSQQGISSSGYTPGPYADLESQLAAFDREYLRSLKHS